MSGPVLEEFVTIHETMKVGEMYKLPSIVVMVTKAVFPHHIGIILHYFGSIRRCIVQ